MIPSLRAVLASAVVLAACGGPVANERIAVLRAVVGDQPVSESAAEKMAAEKEEIDRLAAELTRRSARRSNARLDWQAGELHRLRHLFDEPGAWEEAERLLTMALARDPKLADAHVSLGQLYLTGGFELAPRAERALVRGLELSGEHPNAAARKGLFLAYYYQGRWADALAEADRYLALNDGDADVRKMRQMIETNLARREARK